MAGFAQRQDFREGTTLTTGSLPAANNGEQRTLVQGIKQPQHLSDQYPYVGVPEHNIRHEYILPDDAGLTDTAPASTSIIICRTAMEDELMQFLSLPYEERHAHHVANPFAMPDDMDKWVRANLGYKSPSPPSSPHTQMESRERCCMPPSSEEEGFFADLYERTMQDRASPVSERGQLGDGATDDNLSSGQAMIIAPYPSDTTTPPRPKSRLPNATAQATETIYSRVLDQAASDYCIKPDCPIAPLRHYQNQYLHEGQPANNHLPTFGNSNPPPNVWQAIHNGCQGIGTQHDADLISRFLEYHVDPTAMALIIPDTNFLWEYKIPTLHTELQRPYVRLPFPATPLPVRFDAEPNLPLDLEGMEIDALEHDPFDGTAEQRPSLWRIPFPLPTHAPNGSS
ncbi:MAG: hypothetical protein Q9172_003084 [Xanthocarpia lactea]